MLTNLQTIAASPVNSESLKAFFDNMSAQQLDDITKICNSKMNDKYKMENIMLLEPTLCALDEQTLIVEDIIQQFKKKFCDTFSLDDIKEELLIQKRVRSTG